ncbi:MAG: DUF3237 domain-containing protein [Dehalococcoidia bacterium]
MEPELHTEFLLDLVVDIKPPVSTGAGPLGNRLIFDATGGSFEGPKLKGELLPSGGDWLLMRPDGVMELDVRCTLKTDDGALIFAHYRGVLKAEPAILARFAGDDPPGPDEFYFRTTPRFETGDERYAWLNSVVCVGIGRPAHIPNKPNQATYRVFQIL